MTLADRFNDTAFSRWLNAKPGRAFRLTAGLVFLGFGATFRDHPYGIAALVWGWVPLSSAVLDLCWISGVLGGPLRSSTIRRCHAR